MSSASRRRPPEILLVCTANACRSPMAEALLRQHLAAAGVQATVRSAGTRVIEAGPVAPHVKRVIPGLEQHRSHQVTPDMVVSADLVLGMTREHVREIVATEPAALRWTFALRDFVTRAKEHGIRDPEVPFEDWVAAIGEHRSPDDLWTPQWSPGIQNDDDIADPIGQMLMVFQSTAAELHDLLLLLLDLAWPPETRRPPEPVRASGARWPSVRARAGSTAAASAAPTRRASQRS